MIHVRLYGRPDRIRGFIIWGHARFAPRGRDIVCAGVSAVATTALIGLHRRMPGSIRYGIQPQGLMICRLGEAIPKALAEEAQIILSVMALGLQSIRNSHADFIDISYRR